MKRFITVILVLALCLASCGLTREPKVPTTYPYVFVHGLNGFGDDTGSPVSYWGATGGSLLSELEAQGIMCFAPSVNPAGSAWDRACELYAALTGTRVDYGAAHSAACGHSQYGSTPEAPLFADWGQVDANGNLRKVNLIAHSFGGATARMLCALLHNGSQEEIAASQSAGQTPSPLFTGGKGDWVFSLTCLAAPHNGVSLLTMVDVNPAFSTAAALLENISLSALLESFGLTSGGGGVDVLGVLSDLGFVGSGSSLNDILEAAKTMDTAYYDLSLTGAQAVNELTAELCPDTYLFSYPVDGTNNGSPTDDMSKAFKILGALIGNFTSPEFGIDDSWRSNDCLVNTISATAPFDEPSEAVANPAELIIKDIKAATWYVMPTVRGDHGSVIGLFRSMEETLPLYSDQITRIDALSRHVTG